MNVITGVAIAGGLGVLIAVISAIAAIAHDGDTAHRASGTWIRWRFLWQALALLFIAGVIAGAAL